MIAEGILPQQPKQSQYTWETYVVHEGNHDLDEELLVTRNAVAWSQGNFLRNIYRFDIEGEDVVQAVLTTFPSIANQTPATDDGFQSIKIPSALTGKDQGQAIVILKTKAHIHFLRGSRHIVDLPFEVERAFPAPRGFVVQRKRAVLPAQPPTPQVPNAPPNSFFSAQLRSSVSYLQSPTLLKSFANSQPVKPSPLGGGIKLDALFQNVITTPGRTGDEDVANLYTLSDPLSDLGVITYSVQHHKPRIPGKAAAGLNIEFDGLDPAEQIVYVSTKDELPSSRQGQHGMLTLLVTLNAETNTVSIWHAWYLEEVTLQSLLKQRKEHKAANLRRRSSFLSVNLGTGAATPAVRPREGTRESFAAPGTLLLGEPATSQPTGVSTRKATKEQDEAAMASQMDPDYQPVASQRAPRESSRRISSINEDVRANQNPVNASFAGHGGRRHTSFGGPNERRSLGHRKSRGSTPGSVWSRSLGPDDDSMDLDSTMEYDNEQAVDDVVRHVRATFEAAGLESVFGSTEDFKRELVVRKVHSFSMTGLSSSQASSVAAPKSGKVLTFTDSYGAESTGRLDLYYHDRSSGEGRRVQLQVRHRPIWPELRDSPMVAIPLIVAENILGQCDDIIKLRDEQIAGMLLGGQGILFSLEDSPCPLPMAVQYRAFNPMDITSSPDPDMGKNRLLNPTFSRPALAHAGASGTYDEIATEGMHHRRRIQFRPRDPHIDQLFRVCEAILPPAQRHTLRRIWCEAASLLRQRPADLQHTACDLEFVALVAALFTLVIDILGSKARAVVNMYRVAAGKARATTNAAPALHLMKDRHGAELSASSAWAWTPGAPSKAFSPRSPRSEEKRKDNLLVVAASLADEMGGAAGKTGLKTPDSSGIAVRLMLGLHIFREERKLCVLAAGLHVNTQLTAVIAQLGLWVGLEAWAPSAGSYYAFEGAGEDSWMFVVQSRSKARHVSLSIMERPVGVYEWWEHALKTGRIERYPSLAAVASMGDENALANVQEAVLQEMTPRITTLSDLLAATEGLMAIPVLTVEAMVAQKLTTDILDTLPGAMAAPFKEAIARCEKEPPTTWSSTLLHLVGRDDLIPSASEAPISHPTHPYPIADPPARDVHDTIRQHPSAAETRTREAGRHAVSRLIFHDDRRYIDARGLLRFSQTQLAECPKQPDWDDAFHFDRQRQMMHALTTRMIALPAGDALLHYDSQDPLLTEKFPLPGFSSSVVMLPMGHTLTTDRTGLTEEKVNWAYFHAGVASGLAISRAAKGVDTSWIAFNKPAELTNRHAGLLLALGLGGHLRRVAKWLSFKYLTPKHTMTSVGLLLGLAASHLGTMDSLVTRMLSVHISRMLPPGAAELNVSAATQTAGLMGIGLLYYGTQHRRMSEIMLSEVEVMEMSDPDNGPEKLRDESYRLAAGFALGFINLGKGNALRGLHGMRLPERLLALAVGPRAVHAVPVFDRAAAGAIMAIALVYMKTGDAGMARKIDVPDTEAQFEHVRPDLLLLRALAKHLILWDGIEARTASSAPGGSRGWILDNLPPCYRGRTTSIFSQVEKTRTLESRHVPLFNVFTGLAWALSLKFAGTGNLTARNDLLALLKFFHRLAAASEAYYYDAKLARAALRRCMDVLALGAATVMAGTGDLETFRYCRRLHGRTDGETPYGSHMAAHLAIGALFCAGGTATFQTGDLGVAALVVAFYPLWPSEVGDNRCHLQAFRHLWVLAAEARCLVVEDVETRRPLAVPVVVVMKSGEVRSLTSPCLLPELQGIATVRTDDPAFWQVTLDFGANAAHLAAFRRDQRVFVRRCPARERHAESAFAAVLAALSVQPMPTKSSVTTQPTAGLGGLFTLPAFAQFGQVDVEMCLPREVRSGVFLEARGTEVDERLGVGTEVSGGRGRDGLWDARGVLAWGEREREETELRWLGREVVEQLRARVDERGREVSGS